MKSILKWRFGYITITIHYDHNQKWLFDQIFNFFNHFIFKFLLYLEQADNDTNFDPLYAGISYQQTGLTIRQPFLTIPKYGHFSQKMNFPIDFIFGKYSFLERARDGKNFELSYA